MKKNEIKKPNLLDEAYAAMESAENLNKNMKLQDAKKIHDDHYDRLYKKFDKEAKPIDKQIKALEKEISKEEKELKKIMKKEQKEKNDQKKEILKDQEKSASEYIVDLEEQLKEARNNPLIKKREKLLEMEFDYLVNFSTVQNSKIKKDVEDALHVLNKVSFYLAKTSLVEFANDLENSQQKMIDDVTKVFDVEEISEDDEIFKKEEEESKKRIAMIETEKEARDKRLGRNKN